MVVPLALLLLFGLALMMVDSSAQQGSLPFTNEVGEQSSAIPTAYNPGPNSAPRYSQAPYQDAASNNWSPPQQGRSWYAPRPPASGAPVSADPGSDEDPVDEVSAEEPYVDGENSTNADAKQEVNSTVSGASPQ